MNVWKCMLAASMSLCLTAPIAAFADGEVPDDMKIEASSFQNPTQAERAERIAGASFSEADAEAAATAAAESFIEEVTTEYARSTAFDEAYAYAKERGTSEDFSPNAYETAYDYAISLGADPERASEYAASEVEKIAKEYAESQAVPGNETYDRALAYAEERAMSEEFEPNAFDTAYAKAYANYVAEYPGITYEEIHRMRFVERKGWGEITRYYGLHSSVNGRGRYMKMKGALPEDQVALPEPELLSLDEEIAQATRRNTKTGWSDEPGFNAEKTNRNNGSKKDYGLARTSGIASSDARGNNAGGVGQGKDKGKNGNSSSLQAGTAASSRSSQGGSPGLGNSGKDKGS
ncbi:MAG: hypothetical protein V2I35_01345, partial [Desulfocapsaceae bacterium]|nr:hypothetical protein [Desulfocapsaceae bacterium]